MIIHFLELKGDISEFTKMGLLTDPSVGHGALTSIFVRHHNRFCIVMFIVSVVLFCMLAHYSLSSREFYLPF